MSWSVVSMTRKMNPGRRSFPVYRSLFDYKTEGFTPRRFCLLFFDIAFGMNRKSRCLFRGVPVFSHRTNIPLVYDDVETLLALSIWTSVRVVHVYCILCAKMLVNRKIGVFRDKTLLLYVSDRRIEGFREWLHFLHL